LGAAYASVGRLNESLKLLESAVEDSESMKRRAGQAMRVAWLSAAYMLADRTDQAEALAGRGLELASESKDRGSRAWLLGILGDLKARCGLPDAAETHYCEALQLAQELRMRPLLAHCRLGLGRVHTHSDLPKARSELVEAAELYRSMSMPFWLSQAELSLSELG
jgi:tetratricopeptide (TPR) repeat protein